MINQIFFGGILIWIHMQKDMDPDTHYCTTFNLSLKVSLLILVAQFIYLRRLTIIVLGGGGHIGPFDSKFSEKCPCSPNNYTALIKQISIFDAALVMRNT